MTAFSTGGGGEFVWPIPVGGIVGVNLEIFEDVSDTYASAIGWAAPWRSPENMNVDAFNYITGGTAWSGRTIGLYEFDATGFTLGAELASVSSLSPAASTGVVTTFTPVALTKDTVYWIAAGGGTGTTKALLADSGNIVGAVTGIMLPNTVGSLTIDSLPGSGTEFRPSVALKLTSNTPAASGGLEEHTGLDALKQPLVGLRKSA